jgi:nucleolar protein 6
MSKPEKKTKKTPEEKAARKAAKEAKKAKKLKLESHLDEARSEMETTAAPVETKKKEKKRKRDADEEIEQVAEPKKSKKSKRSKTSTDAPPNEETDARAPTVSQDAPKAASKEHDFIPLVTDSKVESSTADDKPSKQAKKVKKSKKATKSTHEDTAESKDEAVAGGDAPLEVSKAEPTADSAVGKKDRFIVFVGNLPYTATKDELQAHFTKIEPTDIRIMTDKKTSKPKGFAFVEFDRFDRMQTCLKKYNHSVFGDGKKGRKINVELTAGGGGNTSARVFKIQSKNEKLHDERERDREKRSELEAKQDERKKKKEQLQKPSKKVGQDSDSKEQPEENGGIHPSRLAMLQKPAQNEWQNKGRIQRF